MAKVYVFLANGFEDVEALIPVDVLRRGGVEVVTVSVVEENMLVESAHGVQVVADALFDECDFADADLLLLPGGMPGATNLYAHEGLRQALRGEEEGEKGDERSFHGLRSAGAGKGTGCDGILADSNPLFQALFCHGFFA